jgi:pimeloyl-ACP methyl ester carboxylesterase
MSAPDVTFETVTSGDVKLRVAVRGEGPLVVLVHGWPELWTAWRHQIGPLADAGYRVAALDMRGYGGSDKPHETRAYTMRLLAGDVRAVLDHFGEKQAVLVGHDWGAPIVHTAAVLFPERVRAVVGLSVPFTPRGDVPPMTMWNRLYSMSFFYQAYFQDEGEAEAELEADVKDALKKIYVLFSADVSREMLNVFGRKKAIDKMLSGLPEPPLPPWLDEAHLDATAAAFEAGGFRGPLSRYRCQNHDWKALPELDGARLTVPAAFIAGSHDPIRWLVPGEDAYADPGAHADDFRGATIIEGEGHFIMQEAPEAVTEALLAFLKALETIKA